MFREIHMPIIMFTHKLQFYKELKARTVGRVVRSLFLYIIWNNNGFIFISRKCKGFPLSINLKLSFNMLFTDYDCGQNIITHQGNNEKTIAQTFKYS